MTFLLCAKETELRCFDIQVTRDGRWWMIHVPEIDGLTQARYPGEIEEMARDYIAVSTDIPIEEIKVRVTSAPKP